MSRVKFLFLMFFNCTHAASSQQKTESLDLTKHPGLILDLDAAQGLTLENKNRVASWKSNLPLLPEADFVKRDEGRKEKGTGRPTLIPIANGLKAHPAISFRHQELINMEEDRFDHLSQGIGHTWVAVISVHEQRVGLKDVNSFFGNLKNSGHYEGIWACLNDDNTLWWGARNGHTMGRFDPNNPKITGPKLIPDQFYVIAGRMAKGTGSVPVDLFVNSAKPVATGTFPVNPDANPSKLAVGQERDAIQHPGYESFDGQIARFLIWDHPLEDNELASVMKALCNFYLPSENP